MLPLWEARSVAAGWQRLSHVLEFYTRPETLVARLARHVLAGFLTQSGTDFISGSSAMEIRNVGVVGCGPMGWGITQVAAMAGFPTMLREISRELLDAIRALEEGFGSIEDIDRG